MRRQCRRFSGLKGLRIKFWHTSFARFFGDSRTRETFKAVMRNDERWVNDCEDCGELQASLVEALFSELRTACVHLRKELDLLDAIEVHIVRCCREIAEMPCSDAEEKHVVWRFLCRCATERSIKSCQRNVAKDRAGKL
eukprot:1253775-Amphidinium_carterae.1